MEKLTLGERELAIRDCVGAYSFCLHLSWNISILQAHISGRCADDAPVRRRIRVLDLLPARPAAADEGTGSNIHTACTTTASHRGHPSEA